MTAQNELEKLCDSGQLVAIAAWVTRDDYKNGNGAHSYARYVELERVDQGYGWEYRGVLYDDHSTEAFISFDAGMVSAISVDDGDDDIPLLIIILTDASWDTMNYE